MFVPPEKGRKLSRRDFTVGKIQKTRRQRVAKMYGQQKRNIIHTSSTAYEQDQVLSLLIREIVERLQHHDLELQDRIVGLAASVALTLLGLRRGHALDVSAEVLPPHDLLDRFQRITFGADRLKPALNIEKARLPHDSLAPSAHGPLPSASQIRSDLARRIFRGALFSLGLLLQRLTRRRAVRLGIQIRSLRAPRRY